MGLQGLMSTTSLGGRGPASSASSQSRSGCMLSWWQGPSATPRPPPVICAMAAPPVLSSALISHKLQPGDPLPDG